MSDKCRTTPKNTRCGVDYTEKPATSCGEFTACLGLGRGIHYNGACLSLTGSPSVSDGWYGMVHVVNGCIIDAKVSEEATYTPPPCAPNPADCGGGGGGGSVKCADLLSENPANLTTCSNGKLFTALTVSPESTITVTGTGTNNDPLVMLAPDSSGGIQHISSATLSVSGSGSSLQDVMKIEMKEITNVAGTYAGFEIDNYGRVLSYLAPAQPDVRSIVQADAGGVSVDNNGGVVTLSLADSGVTGGTYQLGGYSVTVNDSGTLSSVQRSITLEPPQTGPYTFDAGEYTFVINDYGSISEVKRRTPDNTAMMTAFTSQFRGGAADDERVVTVNMPLDGYIYVEYLGRLPGVNGGNAPGMKVGVSGVSIVVAGVAVPNLIATVDSAGVVAIRGTTSTIIRAGLHEVTVTSTGITAHDAFMKVELVGQGA